MSADMLTAYITTSSTNPEELDWNRAKTVLDSIEDPEQFHFEDPENDAEHWLKSDDDRDVFLSDGSLDIQVLKDIASNILDQLREELSSSEVDVITLGGVTAFISGGLSWGDAPNDACEAIWAAHALPEAVLRAAGLDVGAHDRAAEPLSTRTPAQITNDLQAVVAIGVSPSTEEALDTLVGEIIDSVRDSYALALRDPELGLGQPAVEKIETTVADAVANNWF